MDRVRQIARLAHHVRKVNPDFLLNEEEKALRCVDSFPEWLKATYSGEESDRILKALVDQPVSR